MTTYAGILQADTSGQEENFTTTPHNLIGDVITGYTIKYALLSSTTISTIDNIATDYYSGTAIAAHYDTSHDLTSSSSLQELRDAIRLVLSAPSSSHPYSVYFGDVAKITFSEQTSSNPNAEIAIATEDNTNGSVFYGATADSPGATHSFSGSAESEYGDVKFNTGSTALDWTTVQAGDAYFFTVLHELGHSLGLKGDGDVPSQINSEKYTVMSYESHPDMTYTDGSGTHVSAEAAGLQLEDIAALQHIYGRNYDVRSEDATTYTFGTQSGIIQAFGATNANHFIYTIWDGGGLHDNINALGYDDAVQIDLRQGHFSSIGKSGSGSSSVAFDSAGVDHGNVAIAYHTIIENAHGTTHDDILIGNDWRNSLAGDEGNDTLYGDGVVYDNDHGFNSVTGDDNLDTLETSDSLNTKDPNRTKPIDDDDTLVGGTGADTVYGGKGDDLLTANDNSGALEGDYYHGGGLTGTGGSRVEMPYSVDGVDTVDYSAVHLGLHAIIGADGHGTVDINGTPGASVDQLRSIESLIFTTATASPGVGYDDIVQLDAVFGGTINGGSGADTVDYHAVSVALDVSVNASNVATVAQIGAGTAVDHLVSVESVALTANDDSLSVSNTFGNSYDGGNGIDTIDYSALSSGLYVTGTAADQLLIGSDSVKGFEYISLSTHSDIVSFSDLSGSDADNHMVVNGNGDDDAFQLYVAGNCGGFVELHATSGTSGSSLQFTVSNADATVDSDVHVSAASHLIAGTTYLDITVEHIRLAGSTTTARINLDDALSGNGFKNFSVLDGPQAWQFLQYSDDLFSFLKSNQHDWTIPDLYYSFNASLAAGNSHYFYQQGMGASSINETAGDNDVIQFGSSVVSASVTYTKSFNDLVIGYGTVGDTITVADFFNATTTAHRIEQVEFADNTVHTLPYIFQQLFTQTGTSSDDILSGNAYPFGTDFLYGLAGNDTLDGGGSADTMVGGTGNDLYIVDDVGDVVVESVAEGTDAVHSSVSFALSANVETLILTGSSSINGIGNSLDNIITGNNGNNTLDGGTGADTTAGGTGNDTYVVDNAGDVFTENAGEGTDTIITSISQTLGSTFENLTLSGSGNINATGNSSVNILTGNSGDNTLDGQAGADTMSGGAGNDVYIVDNAGDLVTEGSGAGTDTVSSSVSFTLSTDVENLFLTGSSAINGTGNALGNVLSGNSGNNTLTGGAGNDSIDGGTGVDTMYGGTGNDSFVVDNSSDTVIESSGEGLDSVTSTTTFTLGANVENLLLSGSANINGTGNASSNIITGNSGNNFLYGSTGGPDTLIGNGGDDTLQGSGTGAGDTMIGGTGNDTYWVRSVSDVISENAGEGTDTVTTTLNDYTLLADFENLNASRNGTGNSLNNIILGSTSANTLDGGLGADTMSGDTGRDTYIVDNVGDVVIDVPSDDPYDLVLSSVSYTLPTYVECLTLTGSADINATGNSSNNIIIGNSGNNTLYGDSGYDSLAGGLGDDTYVITSVTNLTDILTENAGAGTDTIQSSVTWTLATNFENLTLTGTANIYGTGNAADNTIIGNSGSNRLDGGGGTDTLIGGLGDDRYNVYSAGDTVIENSGEGTDVITSAISWTLGANIENLYLGSSTNINGTGNGLANLIVGNTGVNILSGLAGDDTLDGAASSDTLIGGTGNDVYVVDNTGDVVTENSGEGTDTVQSGITYTLSTNLENLTLTGTNAINGTGNGSDNILIGNSAANTLDGAGGNDTLDGGAGVDTMIGGTGNDLFIVDNTADVITESGAGDVDTVQSSVTFSIASNANLENLTLTGFSAVTATGNSGSNTLIGNGAGSTLAGGTGNDSYYVGANDIVSEAASAGTDTVSSGLSTYTLTTNVENLLLTGSGNFNGIGNASANILTGNGGDNSLDGGTGTDTLIGGAGNDTYFIDVAADVVTENSGGGTDTVVTAFGSYVLDANVENLTLGGIVAFGSGNALDNIIIGNTNTNSIVGGLGADTMSGLTGNDTYNVDNIGDVVIEALSEGTDLVQSSVSYTLSANVENLTLTGTAISGTGNSLVNTITGNTSDNTLDGGAGADNLTGGAGNDLYLVDNTGDSITEAASAGTDAVLSSASYTLAANIENLTLTGTANIDGTGNALVNILTGNSGDNSLDGSTGADTMIGGAGNDSYTIDNALDVITENAGEGTDYVTSSVTYTLGSTLEHLTLTGSGTINATGNALDNILTGNAGVNILTGNGGNDTLDGAAGADTMIGGTGNDLYTISVATDVITENSSEGTDTVQSTVTYTLGSNVEHLTLLGATAINGTGNGLDNILIGNSGANVLNGSTGGNDTLDGGGGLDSLTGGTGTDTFVFHSATAYSNIDVVTDFTTSQNDVLDLRDMLTSYHAGTDLLTDFVKILDSGANSTVSIDRDGTGTTYGFTQIATLTGVTGLTDEVAQAAAGHLLVA